MNWKGYIYWLVMRGFTLDIVFYPTQWYLWPYWYNNTKMNAGLRWMWVACHTRFPYYKDYLAYLEAYG